MPKPVLHEIDAIVRHEVFTANHIRREFVQHFHPSYSFGVIVGGKCAFTCSGKKFAAEAGDICVIHPYEVHSATDSGTALSYRMVYPRADYIQRICGSRNGALPIFSNPIIKNRHHFDALALALNEGIDANLLQWRLMLDKALKNIVFAHASHWERVIAPSSLAGAIGRACRILDGSWRQKVSFAELASQVGLSKYYFSRQFKQKVGLQPRQYLRQVRLHEAKRLIREGRTLSDASIEAGFFDQPHLTREFCKVFGTTPGRIE